MLRHLFIIVRASIIIFIYYYITVLSPNSSYQLPNNLTLALKMEAVCSSETFLSAYKSVHVTSQKINIESNWVFLKLIICRFWLYQKRKHRFSNNSNMNNRTMGPRVEAIIGWKIGAVSVEKLFAVYEKKCDTWLLTLKINRILQSAQKHC
jgi:hypothetical protein